MEKINTEILISSLISIGFDKVDSLLYTYTLAKLTTDNYRLKTFCFEEKEFSQTFNKYIEYSNMSFKLKNDYTLDTNVSPRKEQIWPIKKELHTNEKLIEYLNILDFSEIISKKLETYNMQTTTEFNKSILSNKEIEIIKNNNLNKAKVKTLKKTN